MWAVAERHPDVVQLLIDAGADVRARSLTYPQTVVGEQTQRAGREELNYTVMRGGATPLLFAARVGDDESARLLLKAGADANDSQPDGCQRAGARRAQRPRQRRGAAAGTRRGSQRDRQRIHRPARGDLEKRSDAGEGAPRARRRSELRDHEGHADAARYHRLEPSGHADRNDRRICWRRGSSSPTS